MISPVIKTPVVTGLLEGYQTFDAVAAMVVGGVLNCLYSHESSRDVS